MISIPAAVRVPRRRRHSRGRSASRPRAVQHRNPIRVLGFECASRDCTEQVMEAEPAPLGVERDEKQIGLLQLADNIGGLVSASHVITKCR